MNLSSLQAANSQGNLTSATVFVAFAAKEGTSSKFQVELDDDKTGGLVFFLYFIFCHRPMSCARAVLKLCFVKKVKWKMF